MDYMDDARYMVEQFLSRNNINIDIFTEEQLDFLVFRVYKNYYGYDMDEEYSVYDAFHETIQKYNVAVKQLKYSAE